MPITNVDGFFSPIEKARNSILSAIDTLDSFSKELSQYSGNLAKEIPLNLKKDIEILISVTDGPNKNSLSQIADYLSKVPLDALRNKKLVTTGQAKIDPAITNTVSDDGIDTTPNMAAGPKSAVLSDSILNKYLKQSNRPVREGRVNEKTHRLSLDLTFDDDDIGKDYDDTTIDTDYSSKYAYDDVSDDDEFIDDEYDDSNEADDWKNVNQEFNPDEPTALSFDDLVEDGLVDDDEDTDLVSAFSRQDIPVDPMQKTRRLPNAAPIDNSQPVTQENYDDDDFGDDVDVDLDSDFDDEEFDEAQTFEDIERQSAKAPAGNVNWKSLISNTDDVAFSKVAGK